MLIYADTFCLDYMLKNAQLQEFTQMQLVQKGINIGNIPPLHILATMLNASAIQKGE